MIEPRDLYEITGELPELDGAVLVHSLVGFMDAGGAGKLLSDHLLATLEHEEVARFDADLLVDYRARRPLVSFEKDHFKDYVPPTITLHLVRDDGGSPFLLLSGLEPDVLWERFTAAVIDLSQQLGVRLSVGVHGIPMAVPHSRPTGYTTHATRSDLVVGENPWEGEMRLPSSAPTLLELRMGEAGIDAMGFAAHVPHYLADSDYPEASLALLRAVSSVSGLLLPPDALAAAAEETRALIEAQVDGNEEVGKVVHALEAQYDAYVGGVERRSLMAPEKADLPSAEQISAEVEDFLRGLGDES